MNNHIPFTIISAELADLGTLENQDRTVELCRILSNQHFSYGLADGVSKGVREQSFIVTHREGTSGNDWELLKALGRKFGQESILHVGSDRNGQLYSLNSSEWANLGQLRYVTEQQAKAQDAYSVIDGKHIIFGYDN